jgi:hypothetical protein
LKIIQKKEFKYFTLVLLFYGKGKLILDEGASIEEKTALSVWEIMGKFYIGKRKPSHTQYSRM